MSALRGADRFRSAVDTLRSSPRRVWWTSFVLVALLSGLWGIANPPFAAPDEPAHVFRAYSLAHGELTGKTPSARELRALDLTDRKDYLIVRVPAVFSNASKTTCFAGYPTFSAKCLEFKGPDRTVEDGTYVGRHPPGYYALVGAVTWFVPDGSLTVHLMRLIGALITGALLATAITALRRAAAPGVVAVGLAIAITPMVLFVSSAVNPSAPEIAASITVWVCGFLLVRSAAERVDRRLVTAIGIAGCVLALSRQLGPFWLALIAVTLFCVSNRAGLRNVARSNWARLWAGLIVVASLVQVGWDVVVKPLDVTRSGNEPATVGTTEILRTTVGRTFPRYREMIGWFGWLDTPAPALSWVPWTVVLGLLVFAALLWSTRRQVAVLLGLVAAVVVVPVAIEAPTYADAGTLTWQGRYTLPLALGVPILAGGMLSMTERGRRLITPRLLLVIGVVLSGAQIVAFGQNLRRYTVGVDGPLAFWGPARWSPPLPRLFLIVAFAAVTIAFVWWLLAGVPRGRDATGAAAREQNEPELRREQAAVTAP
ncbi:MAG TPA: DUF2142 domain-containing protein [Acidimicrobiia bacterium]|nr:DUF2142 domain-containing protein [Acidimicrobiia bacterium]